MQHVRPLVDQLLAANDGTLVARLGQLLEVEALAKPHLPPMYCAQGDVVWTSRGANAKAHCGSSQGLQRIDPAYLVGPKHTQLQIGVKLLVLQSNTTR